MRHFLRRCALCAFTAVLTVLAVTGLVEPANSRADDDCAPGWVWSPDLNQCVFWLPAVNRPGGPGVRADQAGRRSGRARWPWPTLGMRSVGGVS